LVDWPAKLVAFVLMPDHFHLIANPRDGNIKGFIGALKSVTARVIHYPLITTGGGLKTQKNYQTR